MTLKQLCEKLGCDVIGLNYYRTGGCAFYDAVLHYNGKVFVGTDDNSAVQAIKKAYRSAKEAGATGKKEPMLRVVK